MPLLPCHLFLGVQGGGDTWHKSAACCAALWVCLGESESLPGDATPGAKETRVLQLAISPRSTEGPWKIPRSQNYWGPFCRSQREYRAQTMHHSCIWRATLRAGKQVLIEWDCGPGLFLPGVSLEREESCVGEIVIITRELYSLNPQTPLKS